MSILTHLTSFLSNPDIKTLEDGKQALISLRNIPIPGYSMGQSRALWYTLLLYKFKKEQNVPESLWILSREFILTTLRNKQVQEEVASRYMQQFTEWKEQDYKSFVHEVSGFYYQLIELHEAITRVQDPETIAVWRPSYTALIQKVHDAARTLGFSQQMEERVAELRKEKEVIVYDTMHKAYWDMFEEEISKKMYSIFICQLSECRQTLLDILPSSAYHPVVEEVFNMEEMTPRITQDEFGKEEVYKIGQWCLSFLQHWDSQSTSELYEKAMSTIFDAQEETSFPEFVRLVMELVMVFAVELKIRKGLWTTLFRQLEQE